VTSGADTTRRERQQSDNPVTPAGARWPGACPAPISGAADPRYTGGPVRSSLLIALAACLAGASGCARVKPFQREHLARRSMIADRDPGESRFEQHARGSREGADGGTGQPGGGCGCN
jgi:hypothetical protein